MASNSPRPEQLLPPSTALGLSLTGVVLAALYLSILAGSFFPVQLLNPAWQLKFGSALINASPFALLGLALLHLAVVIDPGDPQISNRQRLASRLAVAVSLGFLLLVPLLSVAAVTDQQQRSASQAALIRRADSNVKALRQVVLSAGNVRELRDRLTALNGPVLSDADQALPLSTIKAQVNGLLEQASAQLTRQKQQLPLVNPWRLLPELLRNAFASLALAIGFAGLAQRRHSRLSLLGELQQSWQRLRLAGFNVRQRRGMGPGGADADYFRQISQQEEAEGARSGRRS